MLKNYVVTRTWNTGFRTPAGSVRPKLSSRKPTNRPADAAATLSWFWEWICSSKPAAAACITWRAGTNVSRSRKKRAPLATHRGLLSDHRTASRRR